MRDAPVPAASVDVADHGASAGARHGGLHAIALFEAIKGLLALIAASGLELAGPAPLQRIVQALIVRLHVDPDHGGLAAFARGINPDAVHWAAAAALAYGLLHLLEAWGLWRHRRWASWLGCITAALYLPFDIGALVRHPGWLTIGIVSLNLAVVAVLARDLRRRSA